MTRTLRLDPTQLAEIHSGHAAYVTVRWPIASQGRCPADAVVECQPDSTAAVTRDGELLLALTPPVRAGDVVAVVSTTRPITRQRMYCSSLSAVQLQPASAERPIPRSFAWWAWVIRLEPLR